MTPDGLWYCRECGSVRVSGAVSPPATKCPACGMNNEGALYRRFRA